MVRQIGLVTIGLRGDIACPNTSLEPQHEEQLSQQLLIDDITVQREG